MGIDSLRVGIVCPYSFHRAGGVQNHVIGLAGWLRDNGHSVAILAPGRADDEALGDAGVRPEDYTSAGLAFPVAYNGSVARINFGPAVARRVREWLDNGYFDLLHLHEPITPSVSLLALGQTHLPVASTFHTATPGSKAMEIAYQVLPGAASRIDSPIAVSSEAARVANQYGGLTPRVIGNGINLAGHPLEETTGPWRGGDKPVITFIGRYDEPRKGFQVLLDALPAVRRRHPDLVVRVVGHGVPRPGLDIDVLGALDDAERNHALATSDVYVAPQTGRESFGIVLLEAMASGAPVVASDLPAFREVVSDARGPIGDLFRTGDPDDLARALLASLERPRDELVERGRARAGQFDWEVLGPRIVQAYRDAIRHADDIGPRQPGIITAAALARAQEALTHQSRGWRDLVRGASGREGRAAPRLES